MGIMGNKWSYIYIPFIIAVDPGHITWV
jgi:hypothetical protein